MFTEELRIRVENHFGKPVATKMDAQELSRIVLVTQKEYLSESTIRRFFNLIPSGKTSRTTLNIFSRYIGYLSILHFSEYCEGLIKEVTQNQLDANILNSLAYKKNISIFELNLLCNRIMQLINEQNTATLEVYFNHDDVYKIIKSSLSTSDLFAQTLGPLFIEALVCLDLDVMLNTKYFIPIMLHHYVDVSNHKFDKIYQWMLENSKTPEDKMFAASVLSFNHLLSNNLTESLFYYEKINLLNTGQISPQLQGRIALLEFVFFNNFESLLAKAKQNKEQIVFFSIDIIPYLIITKNIEMLQKWYFHFPNITDSQSSWVEIDFVSFIKMGKYMAEGKIEELKKIKEDTKVLVKSDVILKKALNAIDELYFI